MTTGDALTFAFGVTTGAYPGFGAGFLGCIGGMPGGLPGGGGFLGTCTLVAFGHEKEYNQSLIISSVIYLILLLAMKATSTISFWSLIYLRVFSDLMLLLTRVYFVYKRKILSLN